MKLLSLFRISALVALSSIVASVACFALGVPIEATPYIVPLVAMTFAPLATESIRELQSLLQRSVAAPLAAAVQSMFPTPQTGEPQVTAFA